ncbi:hypothetical protein DFS34DRAFT_644312 [Phlyctochytrium arcticum]|nr:hypothetical protein DFS34DRAFT_644312 [Phlyctochytrium arcticum]
MPLKLPCDHCGDVFLTLPTRQRHIRIKHRNVPVCQESHPFPPSTSPASATSTSNSKTTSPTTMDATKVREEALKMRRKRAHRLADKLEHELPTSREDFIAEMINTDSLKPDFYLFASDYTVDVSQLQARNKDLTGVTPLTDDDFRKSVKLLADHPFTMPDPLTTDLREFEIHLEISRRTLVFMALQDAAAIDKRIKYNEEMVKYGYDPLLVVFESELDFKSMKLGPSHLAAGLLKLGFLKPGQGLEDMPAEAIANWSLPQIMEYLLGKRDSQWKQKKKSLRRTKT